MEKQSTWCEDPVVNESEEKTKFDRIMKKPHRFVSYKDRQFLKEYCKKHPVSASKEGKCYCLRNWEELTVQNTDKPTYGLKYHVCKLDKCRFFRWSNVDAYTKVRHKIPKSVQQSKVTSKKPKNIAVKTIRLV